MKTYTPDELQQILKLHAEWLLDDTRGSRADLRGADLRGADLSGADLSRADLRGANLSEANLSEANLSGANLRDANLRKANLSDANLRDANLYGANLSGAYLRRADLSRANLSGADLRGADLSGANLYGVNLREANLCGADLSGADLRDANLSGADLSRADLYGVNLREANLCGAKIEKATLPAFIICPEEGRFIGWKKARCSTHGYAVLKLRIEENSKRICSLIGRKCRASRVTVVDAFTVDGKPVDPGLVFTSDKDPSFTYQVGKTVFVEANEDIRVECSHGIHFFMTRKEAVEYSF